MNDDLVHAILYRVDIPLVQAFETASGRVSVRTIGLISMSRRGMTGWGEAAPYPGQDESFSEVLRAARIGAATPTLAAATDEAMCDLVARERDDSLISELGPTNPSVPVSMAVGVGDAAISTVEAAWASGVRRFKMKIMPGHTDHVTEIRRLFPEAILGVDANGSFDVSTVGQILALIDLNIAFVEQPSSAATDSTVQTVTDAGFTVFVDESIRSVASAERALAVPAVSGIVVKPGRLGWRGSIEVVQMARTAGKLWRASGLLETGVGRSFSLALAAATDASVSDVAPASQFLSYDVASQMAIDGDLVVPSGPGSGIDVDEALVRERAVEVIGLSGSAIPDLG